MLLNCKLIMQVCVCVCVCIVASGLGCKAFFIILNRIDESLDFVLEFKYLYAKIITKNRTL